MSHSENIRKIGILGGTFNPIHMGHLIIAEQAYEECGLERVYFMPSGISYLKKDVAVLPAKERGEMVKLAIADNEHFSFSDREMRRPGNTYTYETLLELRDEYGKDTEIYFIVGADTLFTMERWKEIETIFKNCILLVSVRNDSPIQTLTEKAEEYRNRYHARIQLISSPNIEIASAKIRQMVSEDRSIHYYVPKEVESYIKEHGFYKET